MFLKFFIAGTFFFTFGLCQDNIWPINAEKFITAVFGEERPNRYHTGIDVRTFGEIGHPLLAINNGYISRIRTSSKKYGKTIYLKLNNGNTAVYAHLDHFTPEIDNLVSALHQHYGMYTIDHQLEKNEYPVNKGNIIGYSGDTGGVSGPHLHFEIRDENDQPINPFKYGLSIQDDIPPIVRSLALIPIDQNSYINGLSEQQIFKLTKINENEYKLEDTINVWGSIGMAVNTYDRITNQEFNFGIHGVDLYQEEKLIYSMQYDTIHWEDTKALYSEKNYSLARQGKGKFHHLFSHHHNQSLTFINDRSNPNFTYNEPGFHNATIKIRDYAANEVIVQIVLSSHPVPKFDYSVNFNEGTCLIQFKTKEEFRPFFYLNGRYNTEHRVPATYYRMEQDVFIINNITPPLDVIEIFAKNKIGLKSPSTFHAASNRHNNNLTGELLLNHYEHGIIIKFEETEISGMDAFISLKKNGENHRYELHPTSQLIQSSNLLSPMELANVTEITVYYESPNPSILFKKDQWGTVVFPNSSFDFPLINDQLIIRGKENTFHDTVYIWAHPIETKNPSNGGLLQSNAYQFGPNLIPFNKEIEIEFPLDSQHYHEHLSIYHYNVAKGTWHFMPSKFNHDSTAISTNILSGEIFAAIKETDPPILSSFIPEINGTYYSSDIEHISFQVEDKLSGIDGETDVLVKLDGKRVIFEYNSYQKNIRYPLKYDLTKGKHTLYIKAKDRVGNKSIIEGYFYIK